MRFLFVLICILYFYDNACCQVDTNKVIAVEELEVDHPNIDKENTQKYYSLDINELLDKSKEQSLMIERLYYSMNSYLKKDTCMNPSDKLELNMALDSLRLSFNVYMDNSQWIENLSYGKGRQAGVRAIIFRIIIQEEYIRLLEYWFNSFYFVYLEPGVFDCYEIK